MNRYYNASKEKFSNCVGCITQTSDGFYLYLQLVLYLLKSEFFSPYFLFFLDKTVGIVPLPLKKLNETNDSSHVLKIGYMNQKGIVLDRSQITPFIPIE